MKRLVDGRDLDVKGMMEVYERRPTVCNMLRPEQIRLLFNRIANLERVNQKQHLSGENVSYGVGKTKMNRSSLLLEH